MVGGFTAASSYYFLLLHVAPSVSRSCLDAPYTRSSKLPPSPAVSYCLPLSTTRLSLLPNPHPQATQCFQKCIRYDDQSSDALIAMGELLLSTGSSNEAEETFQKVLKHDPSNESAQDHLAKIAAKKRVSQNAALRKSRRDSRRKMRRDFFSNSDSEAEDSVGGKSRTHSGIPGGASLASESEAGSGTESEFEAVGQNSEFEAPRNSVRRALPPDPHDPLENLARANLARATSSRLSEAMSPGGRSGARVGFRSMPLRNGSRGGATSPEGGRGAGGGGGGGGFVTTTNLDLDDEVASTTTKKPLVKVKGKRMSSTM